MSKNPPKFQAYSPGIQSLLPMLYVAWADRVLSPSEVQLLESKMSKLTFLTEKDKSLLKSWCNPSRPPSRELFQHWRIVLKNAATKMLSEKRESLVDLGLEIAKKSSREENGQYWSNPETREALEELEISLGLIHIKTYEELFPPNRQNEFIASSFEIEKMTQLLDDDFGEIRRRMRVLLSDPIFKYKTLRDKKDYRNRILEWCTHLAKQGLGALSYPKEYGGEDDMGKYATVFEMLGYHDLSLAVKFGVQFGLYGGSILFLGTKRHHNKYLKDTGSADLLGCFAMTETGHGSNVRGLETTITYKPENQEFVINTPHEKAGKEYIGNALHGRIATVFGQLIVDGENHGVHAILVPYRNENGNLLEGIRVEDCGYKVGLNGVDNGRLWFDEVCVPRENLLNRFGEVDENGIYSSPIQSPSKRFFTMLGTLVGGRVCVPSAGLSAAKSGLAIAIKYALKRRQFGPSFTEPETVLLDYPSHQRRLIPRLAKAYALDFGLTYLRKRYVNRIEEDIREIETLAAALKSYATWFTTETLQECREACGGKGYLSENRFADLKADSDIFTTFEGDNTVLMQLVAKGLLTKMKEEFHDEGTRGVLRFLANRAFTSVAEKNPITIRNTDRDHLLDSEFHLNAFDFREDQLLYSVSQRLRGHIKNGKRSYDAFLVCQTHLIALAEAYAERIILEKFIDAVEECEDINLKTILKKLCDLYALSTIETHKGWYLEANYMEGVKTKAIRRLVDKLCKNIRQEAGALVEAFAIPDELLSAPIAT
ncbi:acyl-CoA dehydrogenase family protein [Saprospiraceae bacterium]|jgi:acyl-CoA oxidase|nr:acyl-CoA dehydrogenase family protein [Bacteroidota bacterium]MDB4727345.1 acyl-CoA dehydrogenase family protein [Saprospiraceae bacterium]MDF1864009.1 acyl-CoA dehydrogenase [Saprospiraceae bacterium]